jgi:hypothetical protein
MKCRKRLTLAFIATDFKQLLACGVFWRKAVLNICLKERMIGNASQQVSQMMLVEVAQRLRRDLVRTSLTLFRD